MLGIKPKLSQFGNQVYDQLWLRKGSPEKIHVIELNMVQNSGYLKEIIYGNHENPRYDGIHFIGSESSRHFSYRVIQKLSPIITKPNHAQSKPSFTRKSYGDNVLPAKSAKQTSDNHSNCPQAKHMRQSASSHHSERSGKTYSEVLKGTNGTRRQSDFSYTVPTYNFFNSLN